MFGIRILISALCAVGLYASVFMLRKARRAQRGELAEASVVQTPRARIFGGLSNALVGSAYYTALGAGIWVAHGRTLTAFAALAAWAAATASAYLAFSLLRVTRMACAYCWTSHAVNWMLAVLTGMLFVLS